jgi:hypothetical protein
MEGPVPGGLAAGTVCAVLRLAGWLQGGWLLRRVLSMGLQGLEESQGHVSWSKPRVRDTAGLGSQAPTEEVTVPGAEPP